MQLTVRCEKPLVPGDSPNVRAVAQMFGLGLDASEHATLVPPVTVPLAPYTLIFVTGASGSGKSTLLRRLGEQLASDTTPPAWTLDDRAAPDDVPLVDAFDHASLDAAMRWLALAGLNDARVMLRRPSELSDGQRARLALARMMQQVEQAAEARPASENEPAAVVLADEFAAPLDRPTAHALARHLRRWTRRWPVCFIAATTHDDLLEPLDPDVLIEQTLDARVDMLTRDDK
jgi:ABC-type ATPase with predicted acetyltransferase domain